MNKFEEDRNSSLRTWGIIIVVAVIVVALAIFIPVYMSNVEKNKRNNDINNATMISNAVLADAAANRPTIVQGEYREVNVGEPSTMTSIPKSESDVVKANESFIYYYIPSSNTCAVYIGEDRTYNLANATQAISYRDK